MPYDAASRQYYTCCYCLKVGDKRTCNCDVSRTTGACWFDSHPTCPKIVNSSEHGNVPCVCRCHEPAVSQAEIDKAIASIQASIRT